MTTQCPICRAPVEVDDAKIAGDGVKAQCGLCDEVFLVKPSRAAPEPVPSSGTAGATRTPSAASSASRRLLEEDVEGAAPRVLVAHDSHAFGELVRSLLEEEGFDVEVVHDGETASRVILERPPLIAILEAGLPKKFGFQLCAELRARPDAPASKFLLVASIYDRKRFTKQPSLATAPDDFLEPRNLELELVPKVRRLLRGRSDATASRAAAAPGIAARRVDGPEPVPEPPRTPDPPSVSRPTVGEDAFRDLFEDSAFSETGTAGAAPSGGGARGAAPTPEPDDDILAALHDPPSSEEPAERPGTSSREADDDELLRTLMRMAGSDGEPSRPSLEDDEVLPDEPETGRAPSAGPEEIPSVERLPDAWRATPDEEKLAGTTGEDELEKLLSGSPAPPDPKGPDEELLRASELDLPAPGTELGAASGPSPAAPAETFEMDADDLRARLERDGGFGETAGGEAVLPGGRPAGAPTLLKGAGTRAPTKATDDRFEGGDRVLPPSAGAGGSFGSAGSLTGTDDDEKSLAEGRVPREMDDELDRLLSGSAPATVPTEAATAQGSAGGATELGGEAATAPAPAARRNGRGGPDREEHEKARRLAKLIVGDILLYNADRIADAVKSGTFFEVMKGDIKDGRDFYDEKVSEDVRRERDYIQEVLEEALENKRKELGLA